MSNQAQQQAIETLQALMLLEALPTAEEAAQIVSMLDSANADVAQLKTMVDAKLQEHKENHHNVNASEV